MKESDLQSDVLAALAANRMIGFAIEYRNFRNCPDLMVFCLDRPKYICFLELKQKKGRVSPGQIDNAKLFSVWGHDVGFARSVDEAMAHCRKVFYGNEEAAQETQAENTTPKWILRPKDRQGNVDHSSNPTRD